MLRNAHDIYGLRLLAKDCNIGHVEDLYFDDEAFTTRYLVANTGNWLLGRKVLISPHALGDIDWWGVDGVRVALTKKQIEDSPQLNTLEPVSRSFENDYHHYYGWPSYWGVPLGEGSNAPIEDTAVEPEQPDEHMRSSKDVNGFRVHASDGDIGHIADVVIDEHTWQISYLVIDTRNWIPGKKVLIAPGWMHHLSWDDHSVSIDLPLETIKLAPEYHPGEPIDEPYRAKLASYYDTAMRHVPAHH